MEDNVILFLKAVAEVIGDRDDRRSWGKSYKFKCPICGGEAYAARSGLNGHLRAECEGCNIRIIQ